MQPIRIWLEYASTYSYLTVARVGRLADEQGVSLEWRPMLLAPVRAAQDFGHPFPPGSSREAYMWRDLERRASRLALPYRRPEVYPVNSLLTARTAVVASNEGWCREFTEAVFRLHWTHGVLMGTDENWRSALALLGRDPVALLEQSQTTENKAALKKNCDQAVSNGIFGSPTFQIGDELFWGDDRLEDALDWASRHRD